MKFLPLSIFIFSLSGAVFAGADPNARDNNGWTPFLRVVEKSADPREIIALLKNGADANAVQAHDGRTALMLACAGSNTRLASVATLLNAGANVNARDKQGMTAFHHAVLNPATSTDILRALAKAGVDVNLANHKGATPLDSALKQKRPPHLLDTLRQLGAKEAPPVVKPPPVEKKVEEKPRPVVVKKPAPLKIKPPPFIEAVYNHRDNPNVFEALLKEGHDINAQDADGRTALMAAVHMEKRLENTPSLKLWIPEVKYRSSFMRSSLLPSFQKKEYPYEFYFDSTPPYADWKHAATLGTDYYHGVYYDYDMEESGFPVVEALLKAGADVNIQDHRGENAAMLAVGNTKLCKLLLDAGLDVDARDEKGETLLIHVARFHTDTDFLIHLLAAGADVNAAAKNWETALSYAARNPNPMFTLALLNAGADVWVVDKSMHTPVLYAVRSRYIEHVRMLVAAGAPVSVPWWWNRSAILQAAEYGNVEIMRVLFDGGVDVKSAEVWRAFHKALQNSINVELFSFLLKARGEFLPEEIRELYYYALLNESPALINTLLEAGMDPNHPVRHPVWHTQTTTALIYACEGRSGELIKPANLKILLDSGMVDIHAETKNGSTALVMAAGADGDSVEIIKLLLAAGADADLKNNPRSIETALEKALSKRNPSYETATLLIEAAGNPNTITFLEKTLSKILSNNKPTAEMVAYILEAGVSPNIKDSHGNSLLTLCVNHNLAVETRELLIQHGAVQTDRHSTYKHANALIEAVKSGDLDALRAQLEYGKNAGLSASTRGNTGASLLMQAIVEKASVEIVAALLAAGADPNVRNSIGRPPLVVAIYNEAEPAILKALLDGGADPNLLFNIRWTALTTAAAHGANPEYISILLDAGTDPDLRDANGKKALEHLRANPKLNNTPALKLLEEKTGRN